MFESKGSTYMTARLSPRRRRYLLAVLLLSSTAEGFHFKFRRRANNNNIPRLFAISEADRQNVSYFFATVIDPNDYNNDNHHFAAEDLLLYRNGKSLNGNYEPILRKNGKTQHQHNNNMVIPTAIVVEDSSLLLERYNRIERHADNINTSAHDDNDEDHHNNNKKKTTATTIRSLWQRRNARSAEEGIRREKASTQLSNVLAKAGNSMVHNSRRYAARTITGLINALAEEVDDLDVRVDARPDTPFWGKHVDAVQIRFSRLGFKPLRMGGLKHAMENFDDALSSPASSSSSSSSSSSLSSSSSASAIGTLTKQFSDISCADEAFQQIDVDNSGALDIEEIANALNMATYISESDSDKNLAVIQNLASELVELYDFNGDGVVDRAEYQSMVEDMAALRRAQEEHLMESTDNRGDEERTEGWLGSVMKSVRRLFHRKKEQDMDNTLDEDKTASSDDRSQFESSSQPLRTEVRTGEIVDVSDSAEVMDSMAKTLGSITFSDLKLDLRRLVFGAVPIIKHITPGGPLILEPFTTTISGSFNREDIMNSALLDAGLRRLVARALRRRTGLFRDFFEGAVFYGRSWKMFGESAPSVEVPKLTDIEFDDDNRLIITGRARIQPRKDAPVIESAFKVRTRIGTRRQGRTIRLIDPELALVLECPEAWDKSLAAFCNALNIEKPTRPKPIYSFFPIYSPFKLKDDDGFDLGEDNHINAIYIQDGALRFELSAILRPGRFLGNHYIAFTVPNRTFIITMDRVKEGIRAAREVKKAAKARTAALIGKKKPQKERREGQGGGIKAPKRPQPKSFFSRFVEGYLQAERDDNKQERLASAVRDFFGRQFNNETKSI